MFANVTIETETREGVLVVPQEAVIRSGRRSLAVVALGEGRFSPREVTLGMDSGDGWVEVQDGLAEGDRVVTSGQFLIDSESRLREAVQKLLGPGEAAEGQIGETMDHEDSSTSAVAKEHEGHAMSDPEGSHEGPTVPALEPSHEAHADRAAEE